MGLETETQPYTEPAGDTLQMEAGRQFGPYKTLRLLGKGGMGVVYLAEQQQPLRRLVALKVIKSGMDTREVIARFESERQALALMDHPNIARVFDAGSGTDGRPYFAMEYVPGIPITEYCDQRRLSSRERLELFLPVCQAAQHAHQKGIIHRDLKPSNVLVSVHEGVPVPKVIDFGVAKAINQKLIEQTFFTEHGMLIGTPEYMSPEQAELNGLDVDTTSDIYSLGILMYELLVGVLPFDPMVMRRAGYDEMRRIIREEETPRPTARLRSLGAQAKEIAVCRRTTAEGLRKQLRGELDWITLKAMEKDRLRRYSSAAEFAADIGRYLNNEPVIACPPARVYRMRKFISKNRLTVAAAASVLTALCAGFVTSTFLYFKAERARQEAGQEREVAKQREKEAVLERSQALLQKARAEYETERANSAAAKAKGREKEAQWQSYVANLNAADLLIQSDEPAKARETLFLCPPQMRDWEWKHLFLKTDSSLATLQPQDGRLPQGTASASPSIPPGLVTMAQGSYFGFSNQNNAIVWKGSNPLILNFWTPASYGYSAQYSSYGPIIAISLDATKSIVLPISKSLFVPGHGLAVFDITSGRLIAEVAANPRVSSAVFSSDGTRAVGIISNTKLVVWETNSGKILSFIDTGEPNVFRAVFSPDGARILSGDITGAKIWDAVSGKQVLSLFRSEPKILTTSVAFSMDNNRVAIGSSDGTTRIWDAASGSAILTLRDRQAIVESVAFSPDSTKVLTGTDEGTVRIWDAVTGKLTAKLLGHDARVASIAFTADGNHLLTAQLTPPIVKVWDAAFCCGVMVLAGHKLAVKAVAFSPNKKLLASASGDQTVRLWDVATGRTIHELLGHSHIVEAVAFSPDGSLLASGSDDRTIRVWDVNSGTIVRTLLGHKDTVSSVAFNQDGTRLVSGSWDKSIKIWDVQLGLLVNEIQVGDWVNSVAFGRDGRIVSSSGYLPGLNRGVVRLPGFPQKTPTGPVVRIWDPSSGTPVVSMEQISGTLAAVSAGYSSDGSRIVAAMTNGTVAVWGATTGKRFATIGNSNASWAPGVAGFHPGGTRIFASSGSTIQIWDARSFQRVLALRGHQWPSDELCLAFSTDGSLLASGSHDNTVRIWETHSSYQP
jgi:WD40 repeat protein